MKICLPFALCVALFAAGLTRAEEPAKEEKPAAPATETQPFEFGKDVKHSVSVPKTWKAQPEKPMRLATLAVPKAEGDAEDGELGFFVLPVGGGVDANVDRWAKQFGGKDSIKGQKKVKTAEGTEATVVEIEGAYTAMAFGPQKAEPKKDYKLLGAIIVLKEGEYFLKLTGPKKTIEAAKAAFEAAVASFK